MSCRQESLKCRTGARFFSVRIKVGSIRICLSIALRETQKLNINEFLRYVQGALTTSISKIIAFAARTVHEGHRPLAKDIPVIYPHRQPKTEQIVWPINITSLSKAEGTDAAETSVK